MKTIRNDEAVSPVIGVILMVAITVILAAVIAAFVFGLAGTTGTSKNVGITVASGSNHETPVVTTAGVATIQGGTDVNQLAGLRYSINGATPTEFQDNAGASTDGSTVVVGTTLYTAESITGTRLIITGTFDDGTSQVLFDKQF